MSAQRSRSALRTALAKLVYAGTGVAVEKLEHCDGCRRVFPLRQVELVGPQILCSDCVPSELAISLHPHLPAHPHLLDRRSAARL